MNEIVNFEFINTFENLISKKEKKSNDYTGVMKPKIRGLSEILNSYQ